jgi:hypothetical protein
MFRRRQINADPRGALERFGLGISDAARWPFERTAWQVEKQLVWPLRERLAGWGPPRHVATAAALAAVAIAAVLAGALLSHGNGGVEAERLGSPARVAATKPPANPASGKSNGPTLQGVPPSFGVGRGVGVSKQAGARSSAADAGGVSSTGPEAEAGGSAAQASAAVDSPPSGEGAAATSSKAKPASPASAGPAAMSVARRFSEAFVFYEIGKRPARAKAVFGETASPQLAEALAKRPPRLPQGTEVPKAEVVNLVPGPRRGAAYTVSVSLLRVGVTSELRLSLQHSTADGWQVADVLG